MFTIWVVFHVIVSVALVLVVLLQSSKGEGLAGSAFGGGGGGGLSGAVFGGRGAASFLSKATTVLAVLFMFNCGALAYMSAGTRSAGLGADGTPESVVTQQAQEDLQRQMQQSQQNMPVDSAGGGTTIDLPAPQEPSQTDSAAGGQ